MHGQLYPATELIEHLSRLPAYGAYQGTLVTLDCAVTWRCGHAHNFESTAYDCAVYEKTKRLNAR